MAQGGCNGDSAVSVTFIMTHLIFRWARRHEICPFLFVFCGIIFPSLDGSNTTAI